MEPLFTLEALISLLTLTSLEVVLGIDNIVFIAIVAGRLSPELREKARLIGLSLAVVTRVMLLFLLYTFMSLTSPLFTVLGHGVSGRDILLLVGGMFLIGKATHEIHLKIDGDGHDDASVQKSKVSFGGVIFQILLIDIVFSLDSVITAVGMANHLSIMVAAIIIAIIIMLIFSKMIVEFIDRHPTIKMLALAFLILVGVMLVAEGSGRKIEKGYIYFAMAFSLGVEMLNIKVHSMKRKKALALEKA